MALDIVSLAKSVAKTVASDGKQRPVCMIETMASKVSPFCSYFYEAYQEMFGNAASANITQVVQYINLSYPGVMESEFMTILNTLHDQGYEPDSFIAFSEYVFTTINNVEYTRLIYLKSNSHKHIDHFERLYQESISRHLRCR